MVLKALKDMLFEDEPQTPQQPAAQPVKGASSPPPHVQGALTPPPSSPTSLNQAMIDAIKKSTFARNTALTSLINASEALADIIPDPVMRLKAAHKTAGAGRSSREIAEAVAIHLNDVDAEELRFNQVLSAKIQSEVGGLINQADTAEKSVTDSAAEIQKLQERIGALQQKITEQTERANALRGEAQAKEQELRQAEVEFKAAAQYVRNELNSHKDTITSTLG